MLHRFFRRCRLLDLAFFFLAIGVVFLIVTRYQMPFRLDDVIYIQWAQQHGFFDSFDIGKGEIFLCFRPVIAMTMWVLTHTAGTDIYWPWHLVLASSFVIALTYTGLTTRLISEKFSALYIAVVWYPLAFLSILNVVFWYADMTYSLEMMFVSMAWYYGLRAIFKVRFTDWLLAMGCCILAVLTKEPAIVLVNGILLGTVVLFRKDFFSSFKNDKRWVQISWFASYAIVFSVSFRMYLASSATSTRFFHPASISRDQFLFFISDRLSYYSDVLLSPIFLASALVSIGVLCANLRTSRNSKILLWVLLNVLIIFGSYFSKPYAITILLISFIVLPFFGQHKKSRILSVFSLIALLNATVLLVTIMLVKTQITELAFLLTLIASSLSSIAISSTGKYIKSLTYSKRKILYIGASGVCIIGAVLIAPKLNKKEQLLREVKASRSNANDAIKWMSRELPSNSSVLVTAPNLFGISNANDLTSKDDEYKLYAQPTFLQGFIRVYFNILDRDDILLGYLEDSVLTKDVFTASRENRNTFLFLQTPMDVQRFHSHTIIGTYLKSSDSLIHSFGSGGIRSEIWKLQ